MKSLNKYVELIEGLLDPPKEEKDDKKEEKKKKKKDKSIIDKRTLNSSYGNLQIRK